tara:strand:+ start:908 stop:3712 length:2805 start_codon:yes stop_codon:yes gene_type:complete
MGQNPLKRESLLFINAGTTNQLGTNKRRGGPAGEQPSYYVGNHFLRSDWGTVDRFRGVQGNYIASLDNEPRNRAPDSRKPLYSSRIHNFIDHFGPYGDIIPPGQKFHSTAYLLEPNVDTWNNGDVAGTLNMLQKYIQDPGVNEGNPYYSYFLEEGVPVGNAPYMSLIPAVFNRPGNSGSFMDHTFSYLKPSENREDRDQGGIQITVEPVYNFYLDTMPEYEQVTMNVPEAILPNFYIFETELRNTGSQTYSPDYKNVLTLYAGVGDNPNRMEDWFVENEDGSWTEGSTKSYYQAYASSLQAVKSDEANYNALKTQYNNRSKNIAVLHSDIGAIHRTSRVQDTPFGEEVLGSALSFLPFYNIVTVGADQYAATEGGTEDLPSEEDSWFASLYNVEDFDAESFIDLLQMYIITMIEKGVNPNAQFHEFAKHDNPNQTLVSASLYFDLSQRFGGAGSLPGVPPAYDGFQKYADFLEARITENISTLDDFSPDTPDGEGNQYWERDNVVLIRDYSNDSAWVATGPAPGVPQNPSLPSLPSSNRVYNPPTAAAVKSFYDWQGFGRIQLPMRNFDEVLSNQGAFSETILYKIDKRVVNSAGDVLPNIVQTIYLSPKIDSDGALQYIDSQVRYGVRYQYDIQQVRVVFGNEYQYDDLKIYFAGFAGYGRAVGNALGFYQAEEQDIIADAYVVQHLGAPSYLQPGTDTAYSTEQNGYFGVAPTNAASVTLEQWNYMAQGSDYGDAGRLKKINLIFKRGYGFLGNPDGGAVSGEYSGVVTVLGGLATAGMTIDFSGGSSTTIINIPPSPVPGSSPTPAPGTTRNEPGVEAIAGFEKMSSMTDAASGHTLDSLTNGLKGDGGASFLPPFLSTVLQNLPGTGRGGDTSGPFDGNPGGFTYGADRTDAMELAGLFEFGGLSAQGNLQGQGNRTNTGPPGQGYSGYN